MNDDTTMVDFENALSKSLNEGMEQFAVKHGLPVMWWTYSDDFDINRRLPRLRINGHPRNGDLGPAERAAVDAWGDHFGFEPGVEDDRGGYQRQGPMPQRPNAVVVLWGVIDAEKWRRFVPVPGGD